MKITSVLKKSYQCEVAPSPAMVPFDLSPTGVLFNSDLRWELSTKIINLIHHILGQHIQHSIVVLGSSTGMGFHVTALLSLHGKNSFFTTLLSLTTLTPLGQFCKLTQILQSYAKQLDVQIHFLIFFLTHLIDLAKASKLSRTWILLVFELQLALP